MAGTTTPLVAKKYSVELLFFFGKGQKSDIDNLGKLPLDALVEAGLIHSDAAIMELLMCKYRDEANPRTVIKVTAW
jgi:Holliday junction resolvase RusA-like endonuclease